MEHTRTDSTVVKKSRRHFVVAGAAAAAAAVAGLTTSKDAKATAGAPMILGGNWTTNDAGTSQTNLVTNVTPGGGQEAALAVLNASATGKGLSVSGGYIGIGTATRKNSTGPGDPGGIGIMAVSEGPTGWPSLGNGGGVLGWTSSGNAVAGICMTAAGTNPPDGTGTGVLGNSGAGTGVRGRAQSGIGVHAMSNNVALDVEGKSRFKTVGNAIIPDSAKSIVVPDVHVSAGSHVMVTLTSDPDGAAISWVDIQAGQFEVHMTKKVKDPTTLRYLVVDPRP